MKIVYERSVEGTYNPRTVWTQVEVTGRCKTVAKGPYLEDGESERFMEIRRKGIILSSLEWVPIRLLKICDPVESVVSWCTCLNEDEPKRKTK